MANILRSITFEGLEGEYKVLQQEDLQAGIDTALAQAKASGEFKGDKGDKGDKPVRGTDYWTATDIATIKGYVDSAILGGAW